MADILEIILSLLNVDTGNRFIQDTIRAGPLDSVFYLIFFPTVFIILFIFILTRWILDGPGLNTKGFRILISISIYAFIIMQGWFTQVILITQFWFAFVIVIFGLFIFTRHFTGRVSRGGGGAAGGLPGFGGGSGFTGSMSKVLRRKISQAIKKKEQQLELYLNMLEESAHDIDNFRKNVDQKDPDSARGLSELQGQFLERFHMAEGTLKELEGEYELDFPGVGPAEVRAYTRKYRDRLEKISGKEVKSYSRKRRAA